MSNDELLLELNNTVSERLDHHEARFDKRLGEYERRADERFSCVSQRLDSLHTTLTKHTATEDDDRATIKAIEKCLKGNGQEGHVVRLDRLERFARGVKWFFCSVFIPVVLYGIYVCLQRIF